MAGQPNGNHKEADVEDIPEQRVKRFLGNAFVKRNEKTAEYGQVVCELGILTATGGHDSVSKEAEPDNHRNEKEHENDPQQGAFHETFKVHRPIFPFSSMQKVIPGQRKNRISSSLS
jgi:hypothetical protein